MEKICGVYKITNTVTGDFYIGSSKNAKQRWIEKIVCTNYINQLFLEVTR